MSDRELRELERAARLSPDDATAHVRLGLALSRAGDLAEARTTLLRAVALAPRREMPKVALREVLARIAARELPDDQGLIQKRYRVRQLLRSVNDEAPLRVFSATDLQRMRRVVLHVRSYVGTEKPEGSFEKLGVRLSPARELRHPNVIAISDLARVLTEGSPFVAGTHEHHVLACEQRPEPTLDRLIALGPMEAPRAARILRQILLACEAAHRRGVIHRLLSPRKVHLNANWVAGGLATEDHVRVRGFGVVTFLGEAGRGRGLHGTAVLAYAPPEVIFAHPSSHRADLYAAGAIAYALLNGGPPFGESTKLDRLRAILHETPAPLPRNVSAGGRKQARGARRGDNVLTEIPRRFEALVMSLLAREPNDRPASAREAIDELDASLA